MTQVLAPRPWPVAALAGAAAAAIPLAMLMAAGQLVQASRIRSTMIGLPDAPPPGWTADLSSVAINSFATGMLVFCGIAVPLALLFSGLLAWLERTHPAARGLTAWSLAGAIAAAPFAALMGALLRELGPALLVFIPGVVGAGAAWAVRHRLGHA